MKKSQDTDKRKKSIYVAVVDDHLLIRQGIISYINRGHRIKVVGEASNGNELFDILNDTHVDVVLLDVQMTELNGPETLRRIQAEYPHVRVLVISMFSDRRIIKEMLRMGACGYVNKDIQPEELIDAIYNTNFRGMHAQNEEMRELFTAIGNPSELDSAIAMQPNERLKERDLEILQLICEGYNSEEIAEQINLSKQSVNLCRLKLIAHFGVRNMAHLVAEAIRLGYYFP
jgi:DNA-binding NarL/FixJ family response regulator